MPFNFGRSSWHYPWLTTNISFSTMNCKRNMNKFCLPLLLMPRMNVVAQTFSHICNFFWWKEKKRKKEKLLTKANNCFPFLSYPILCFPFMALVWGKCVTKYCWSLRQRNCNNLLKPDIIIVVVNYSGYCCCNTQNVDCIV